MNIILSLYRFIFCRPIFYKLNLHLYKLSLRGIGVLNSEGNVVTGETWFIEWLQKHTKIKTVIDVGANTGDYTSDIQHYFPKAKVYSCEPHPLTFKKLEKNFKQANIHLMNVGLSDKKGTGKLWDFAETAPLKHTQPTSTLSSLNKEVIEDLHHQPTQAFSVTLTTLDDLAKQEKITSIDLLKIDTEGTELTVLKGATELLKNKQICIVQFEFNEMNAYTKTFLKDFIQILPDHVFYRLMPKGLFPLGEYRPLTHELFAFQNIVALPKKLSELVTANNI